MKTQMQFNDVTNELGICQEIDSWCDSDTTSYSLAKKTRRANTALETVESWILMADGTWQFDDLNYGNTPVGTFTLVEGQSQYTLSDTFILEIEWVKIKNASGYWQLINPIDQAQLDQPLENYLISNGFPVYYDKNGNTLRLYPAPTSGVVTLANGLKVGIKRTASLFAASDTTKEPGFAQPYHIIIAWMAARPYCMTYKPERVAQLNALIGDTTPTPSGMKKQIINFYSLRERDARKVLRSKPISFR